MNEIAIRCEGLGKRYRIGQRERYRALRDTLTDAMRSPLRLMNRAFSGSRSKNGDDENIIWALRDVSFEIKRGEVVGIIGRNGAGKSTLLKILSRITMPTEGMAEIHGRVGSLLEVGTGFHPELTGRENIYLNGSIMGMRKAETRRKFDDIVAFAEVSAFIDTPVKRYSSGMYVRLAFAVAAHLEPEILVVDEVLAVGDTQFQKKCLGKMNEVAKEGRTVFFVSHDMTSIQGLCQKGIILKSGKIFSIGPAAEQIEIYLNTDKQDLQIGADNSIWLEPNLELLAFEFAPNPIMSSNGAYFSVELRATEASYLREIAILIYNAHGRRVAILDLRRADLTYTFDGLNSVKISGKVESLPLVEGDYYIGLYLSCAGITRDFYDLLHLRVAAGTMQNAIVPYHAASRGVVELDYNLL